MPRAFNKKQLSIAVSGVLSIVCCLTLPMVFASEKSSLPSQALHRKELLQFNIASQKLDQALLQFAQQADVQLIFKSTEFGRWQGRSVQGEMLLEQGLTQLLADAPVTYEWITQQRVRLIPLDVNALVLQSQLVLADAPTVVDTRNITQTAKDITRLAIQDERDLVRNITGVTVVEGGRGGSNGFSIRGVDADRVAVTVDGVAQAESFAPDVYQGYGYLNGTRNNTELENIQQVVISKGADSFLAGSGAIGGAVQFRTKNVDDFIHNNEHFGLLGKLGYSSKNSEWRQVVGGAVKVGKTGALLQYTERKGSQFKHAGGGYNGFGSERERPDPQDNRSESWLAKAEHCINDEHCLDLGYEDRQQHNKTIEKSYSTMFGAHRTARDKSPYRRWSAGYTWLIGYAGLDELTLRYADQEVAQQSITKNYWETDPSHAYQTYDRKIEQHRQQVDFGISSLPLEWLGLTHHLKTDLQYAKINFTNENHDATHLKGSNASVMSYNIINPVTTTDFNFRFQDSIEVSELLTASVGLRYDHYQHKPRLDSLRAIHLKDDRVLEEKIFSTLTWFAGLSYQATDIMSIQYKLGTGFRAPKAAELYFEYTSPPNFINANPDLKAEYALNHELSLVFDGYYGQATVSGFVSRYKDFIEERHQTKWGENPWYGHPMVPDAEPLREEDHFQFVNIDRATVHGVEFNGRLDMASVWSFLPAGTHARLTFTQARGRLKGGDGMRALQPFKLITGVGYESPNQHWGLHYDLSYFARKRQRDTRQTSNDWRGEIKNHSRYLNQSAYVSDLRGYWNAADNFTISGGMYNVFNKKYSTWDSMRSIPEFGTTNMIGWQDKGLHRFTAPARNFAVVLEARY